MSNLVELTNKLSTAFDTCLDDILTAPIKEQEQQHNTGNSVRDLDTQIAKLKSTFLEIERQVNDVRLKALSSKELSVLESNKLLKKDISIKKNAIEKYTTKIEEWEKELPVIKENGRQALALRTDGQDFDATNQAPPPSPPPASKSIEQEAVSEIIPTTTIVEAQSAATTTPSVIKEDLMTVPSVDKDSTDSTLAATQGTSTMDVDADEDDEDEDMEFEEV